MIDKILIFLLIVALPVTIFVTYKYILPQDSGTASEETLGKLDALISQLEKSRSSKQQGSTEPEISISAVFYASESGVLKVAGLAPHKNMKLLLAAVPIEKVSPSPAAKTVKTTSNSSGSAEVAERKKTESEDDVLGTSVEVRALKVGGGGEFSVEYPVEEDAWSDLELRFEQAKSIKTIIYHFDTGKYEEL